MLLDKLRDYYGMPDDAQTDFIKKRVQGMSERQQDDAATKIIESCSKRFGFPEISTLAKYLTEGAKHKVSGYYWSVCDTCHAEYDYQFNYCPACYLAHRPREQWKGYKVRTSDNPPPMKVIRWNITLLNPVQDGMRLCATCPSRDGSFCRGFGNPEWTCQKSDYDMCECKQCCALYKKANRKNDGQ